MSGANLRLKEQVEGQPFVQDALCILDNPRVPSSLMSSASAKQLEQGEKALGRGHSLAGRLQEGSSKLAINQSQADTLTARECSDKRLSQRRLPTCNLPQSWVDSHKAVRLSARLQEALHLLVEHDMMF